MTPDFYESLIRDLDAIMSSSIRKQLKKCARHRESTKNLKGSILDDWTSIKKAHLDAVTHILEGTEHSMQIAGVLKHCQYVPIAQEEED